MATSTQLHDIYVVSENITAKLKILNYEVAFCQARFVISPHTNIIKVHI